MRLFSRRNSARPPPQQLDLPSSEFGGLPDSPMCKSKGSTRVVEPNFNHCRSDTPRSSQATRTSRSSSSITDRSNFNLPSNYNTSSWTSRSSGSTPASLSSIRESLPENPHVYDFSEIFSATGNFLSKKFSSSSSSSSWRCSVRGKDVVIFQRKLHRPIDREEISQLLSVICRSHHVSLIKLLGVSISGNHIYLVYDYVEGASLADCLRNPRNPSFTILSNWMSRMQIAADLAHGLDYIHHCTGTDTSFVHNRIKSSSIVVTNDSLNAKICHFGTAQLCGEIAEATGKISDSASKLKRSGSRVTKIMGTRGYMAPEFQLTGLATRTTDVYAFGVVILELLSGAEALKYYADDESGAYKRVSVIETAREAIEAGAAGAGGVRIWMDRRLKDSFPMEVAEKMTRLGLECVEEDPDKRPDMGQVAGRISKLYLESKHWADRMGVPTDFSVSIAPR